MNNSEQRGKAAVQALTGDDLKRGFQGRQVAIFATACSMGTSLTISSGTASRGGPASLLISYLIGLAVFFIMTALREMAAYIPMNKGFSGYANRYAHPDLGFATGWNYYFSYAIAIPTNLTAAGLIVHYWRPDLKVGIWITVFGAVAILLNACPHIGFKYWHDAGALGQYLLDGRTDYLLGWWTCMIQACFAYTGTEVVGVAFGEASNPHKIIPMAIRQTFWRILGFYVIGVWAPTMAVPYTSPELVDATSKFTSAAASPYVVAISLAEIKVLPDIVNAGLIIFVASSAASDIYCASRSLYGLPKDGQAPKLLAKTLENGVPAWSVGVAALFFLLGYMNAARSMSTVFDYFVQGISLTATSYSAILQPYGAYYSMFITILCIIFFGYDAFIPHFKADQFVLRYIGIVIYMGNFLFWRSYKGARYVRPREMDLTMGFYDSVLEGSSEKNDVEVPGRRKIEVRASELEVKMIREDGMIAGQ
ncbi:amino acid permease-domain-containing protein [Aspergillus falconensis]